MKITAQVVADSMSLWGDRLTTFRLRYPRFIHAQFMTHRMFSRNVASSRAIPVESMIAEIQRETAMPMNWGSKQSGMQAGEELDEETIQIAREIWISASGSMSSAARILDKLKLHKQHANRVLEAFVMTDTIASMTDLDNALHLRYHDAAQPEISALFKAIYEAIKLSEPKLVRPGEWHLPFITKSEYSSPDQQVFESASGYLMDLETAKRVSVSLCAQVSFRKEDDSVKKATDLYQRLAGSYPIHASPFEHVATPFSMREYNVRQSFVQTGKNEGLTDPEGFMYCGNFRGWVQYRKQIAKENIRDVFVPEIGFK
jgi:thymidylate synthase ThyX